MTTRRNFLRKAAIGSAAFSATGGFAVLASEDSSSILKNSGNIGPGQSFPGWEVMFEESKQALILKNGSVLIEGQINFISGGNRWSFTKSRDGIQDRFAILDTLDNVQGYFVINKNCGQLNLLFYHRTAQSFSGIFSLEGRISFQDESFACITKAKPEERILALNCGRPDSLLNNSVFAPESDTALILDAAFLQLETRNERTYSFTMSGEISESSEAIFAFDLERDYFKNRYIPYYHPIDRKRCPIAPTGWMSWNTYFDKATADDNLAEAKIGQKYLQPFGCEFWSIESWQGNSDHLPVSDFYNMNLEVSKRKFPKGMKQLADDIRKLGFRPGLWTAPFGTGSTEFYNSHKDWFLHDKSGTPLSCWNGRYSLDPTVPEAREHLRKIHRIASHDWGYEFFKIDGMSGRDQGYCAHFYERPEVRACFRDPSCQNPFELCVKALREGIGEDRVFLACQGHTTGPEVLYADASRIGADIVEPDRPVQWHGVMNQGRCFMAQAFTHNIAMVADPDTLLVRDLPMEEARLSATVIALPGQLTFFGDKLAGLPTEKMKLLQQTLPPADVLPGSLYPYFTMLPVWNLRVNNPLLGNYNIVALFNWLDDPQSIRFTTSELGIDSKKEYVLYEFWTQKALGLMKTSFSMDVPSHGVRLIAVHEKKSVPQWAGSDRHIAQTAKELKEYFWNNSDRMLEGKIQLIGTFSLAIRLHIPENYTFSKAECSGAECSASQEPNGILAINFKSEKTGDYPFRIYFK